jgi:hypothetical protein
VGYFVKHIGLIQCLFVITVNFDGMDNLDVY